MKFKYNDGGREAAGFKGKAGDCVVRAVAIATGRPYSAIHNILSDGCYNERKSTGKSAGSGVRTSRKWFKDFMAENGFKWTPTMRIGTGCKVHLKEDELPMGRLVVSVSRHLVAVIDGVINDTYPPDRAGTRCVYGYWKLESPNA